MIILCVGINTVQHFKRGALFLQSGINHILLEKHKETTGSGLSCNCCKAPHDAQCCSTNLSLIPWAFIVPKSDGDGAVIQKSGASNKIQSWSRALFDCRQLI